MTDGRDVGRRFDGLEQKLERLSASVDRRFDEIDRRFEVVDRRFDAVDRRFEQVDQRFEQVDHRFEQVDHRFQQVDERFEIVIKGIAAEGDRTRRHFDIVVEQMKAEFNLMWDKWRALEQQLLRLTATNATEHAGFDRRISTLEGESED